TAAAIVPLFLVVGGMAFVRAVRPPTYARIDPDPNDCNGSPILCDKRLDQVAFAATHNSMSAETDSFTGAHQRGGLLSQLTGGVRAFLIDFHYGGIIDTPTFVHTDLPAEAKLLDRYDDISPSAKVAFEGGLKGLGLTPPTHSVYLCHDLCEAGATR